VDFAVSSPTVSAIILQSTRCREMITLRDVSRLE